MNSYENFKNILINPAKELLQAAQPIYKHGEKKPVEYAISAEDYSNLLAAMSSAIDLELLEKLNGEKSYEEKKT